MDDLDSVAGGRLVAVFISDAHLYFFTIFTPASLLLLTRISFTLRNQWVMPVKKEDKRHLQVLVPNLTAYTYHCKKSLKKE